MINCVPKRNGICKMKIVKKVNKKGEIIKGNFEKILINERIKRATL